MCRTFNVTVTVEFFLELKLSDQGPIILSAERAPADVMHAHRDSHGILKDA